MLSNSAKVRRYEQRIEQFRQSKSFDFGQKKMHTEYNVPNTEESKIFWGDV